MEQEYIGKITDFLHEIGIQLIEKELDDTTFLPGLALGSSCIYVDKNRLKYPGDLLHEAGHIAVTKAEQRPKIGTQQMPENWPDQGEEMAAILWSYAAIQKLKLPPEFVFHPHGYKGTSDWFIGQFESKNYIGLPLLEWKGMTLSEEKATKLGKQAFPEMINWLCP